MQIKRYETKNLQEATFRIKHDLGSDAIILSTSKIPGKPNLIEVLAARDEQAPPTVFSEKRFHNNEPHSSDVISCLAKDIHELKCGIAEMKQEFPSRNDLSELKETMDLLLDTISVRYPAHMKSIYTRMVASGISRRKSSALIETILKDFAHEERDTYEKSAIIAETLIARSLMTDDPQEKRIKAFIGPTGVGKTTTLAKLAAHYSLEKKMKVGVITTDTYRIAAGEQLKVYAKIMGLPIQIAPEKKSFLHSVASFADKEMILIDTPGRNQNDDFNLNKLKSIFHSDVENILLLNPVVNREHLLDTANRFRIFEYDRIILTKVDECRHFGSMYEVLNDIGKPVSHVTTGQNVPRDIEKASPERLARLILHDRLN
jgi:flagellar biosynthesis protein FlhF